MSLPLTLTLVRHGQSEANVVQKALRRKMREERNALASDNHDVSQTEITALEEQSPSQSDIMVADANSDSETEKLSVPEAFFARHDSNMRLTPLGVEQAEAAGRWLAENGPNFDRFYVSPHTRTRETAYHLNLEGVWRLDDRIRERDWGEIHSVTRDFTDPQSDASRHNRKLSAWYWKPQAGESLATGVRLRVESILNSLYRKGDKNKHAIAVTHGEFISVSGFVIERMTPDAWTLRDENPDYKIQNTMIVQYSRVNPNDPTDISSHFRWRRAICPWDRSLDWDNGEWVGANIRKYSNLDLITSVNDFERILSPEDTQRLLGKVEE